MKSLGIVSLLLLSEIQKIEATPISSNSSSTASYTQSNSQSSSHHTAENSISASAGLFILLVPVFALLAFGATRSCVKSNESSTGNGMNSQYTPINGNVGRPMASSPAPARRCC